MSSTPGTKILSPPDLKTVLDLLKGDIMATMNCHGIAEIQSFNAATQTCTAQMLYKRVINGEAVAYPVLIDCPVVFLQGGKAALTFPIQKGDTALILFNDRDIDNWFSSGQVMPVNSNRLHSFSDAMALVGLRSKANPVSSYDITRAKLAWGDTMVGVSETLVKIANNSTTLNTLLQSLIDHIKNLVTQTAAITVTGVLSGGATSGPPANAAAITAISTNLTSDASDIAGLLE